MRQILFIALCCTAAALPCQSQVAPASRPRFELPVAFVLDTTLVPASRIVAVGPTGVVTVTRLAHGVRLYSQRPVRFDANLMAPACGLGVARAPVGTLLGRLRTDSTWVFRLEPFRARCLSPLAVRPSR